MPRISDSTFLSFYDIILIVNRDAALDVCSCPPLNLNVFLRVRFHGCSSNSLVHNLKCGTVLDSEDGCLGAYPLRGKFEFVVESGILLD